MALVYKARDTLLNRQVTVKVLRSEYTCDEEFVVRFRREAQAVAKLSHPNIVSVYDVGLEGDTHYIVMEYVEGNNLKEIIREEGALPVNRAVDIARQICEGLDHAHENGIVHRDIKPHNILVTAGGKVKVTDFGIARAVTSGTVTHAGTIVGSVHYFSPEQAKGENTGVRSDIYSAGTVLYEMVTGQVPFQGDSPIGVALKHIQEQPKAPTELNKNISPELEKVILRAMEKDILLRYQTAGDMARDLRTVLFGQISDETRYMDTDEFATRVLTAPRIIRKEKSANEEEPAPRQRRKKMRPMVKAMLAVIIIGLLAGAATGINSFLNVPDVTVPNLVEMPLDKAVSTLQELKLNFKNEHQNHPTIPVGDVISQDPEAGKPVKEGFTVNLIVSKGPEYKTVPDVRKKEETAAKVEIENAGFKPDTTEVYSDEVEKGAVVAQTPAENTQAIVGSTVTLEISKGREPKFVPVPDLKGRTLDEARQKLSEANLKLLSEQVTQAASQDYLAGYVMAQQPNPGEDLQEGEAVQVTLSKGPGPEAKTATVFVEQLPDDNRTHPVQIVVTDVTGTRTVYDEIHNAGEQFSYVVTYYKRGKIQVLVDGNIVEEQAVK